MVGQEVGRGSVPGIPKRAVNVEETHKDVQKGDSLHRTVQHYRSAGASSMLFVAGSELAHLFGETGVDTQLALDVIDVGHYEGRYCSLVDSDLLRQRQVVVRVGT